MIEKIKYYTDEHIDERIVQQLRARGVDIIRCQEVGMLEATDEMHLAYATAENRVMVSCDQDFLRLHQQWQKKGRQHAGITYMHPTACNRTGTAVRTLFFWHEAIEAGATTLAEDVHNQIIYVKV